MESRAARRSPDRSDHVHALRSGHMFSLTQLDSGGTLKGELQFDYAVRVDNSRRPASGRLPVGIDRSAARPRQFGGLAAKRDLRRARQAV